MRSSYWEKTEDIFKNKGPFNIAYYALDQHRNKKNPALCFVDRNLSVSRFSYKDLSTLSNKFAHVLQKYNIQRGDTVFLFLPRIPEVFISFFGVLKTGAIVCPLFSAFTGQSLIDRLRNGNATIVVTTKELLPRITAVIESIPTLKHIIVIGEKNSIDKILSYENEMETVSSDELVLDSKSSDDAFLLYTSGSTGKPKGVLHSHMAVLQQYETAQKVFAFEQEDIFWCTADPGWITGVSYTLIAPLLWGITSVMYEGRFEPKRWIEILKQEKVNVWYTAPTALRMLMAEEMSKVNLSSLRSIASVGEPLNPEVIKWANEKFSITIQDTWYQTELGSITIGNYYKLKIRPGSMGKVLDGITAAIVDEQGTTLPPFTHGNLVLKPDFASFMKDIWHNHAKYNSYIKNGWYYTGDIAYQDDDGYFYFQGRSDDIIETSGERIGPFEVESCLITHPSVVEAGVIGKPDQLRGEIIKAFIVLKKNIKGSDTLKNELSVYVKKHLGGHMYPREIAFVLSLPKTRSGKIMRRVLKAQELHTEIGDISSLDDNS